MSEVQTPAVKLTAAQKLANKLATLFARISKDTAEYNELIAEQANLERLANVKADDVITFLSGKGDAAVSVQAVVLGVVDGEAKVTYGEGFDTVVTKIKLAAITSVIVEEVAEAATVAE